MEFSTGSAHMAKSNSHDGSAPRAKHSLRELNKRRVAQDILRAATDLIAVHGYEAVTVTQIAEAAGIGRRTFFHYFAAKDDLMFSRADEYGAFMLAEIRDHAASMSADVNLELAIRAFARMWLSDQTHISNVTRAYYEVPELRVRLYGVILKWQARWSDELHRAYGGPTSHKVVYQTMVASGFACFMSTLRNWSNDMEHVKLEKMLAESLKVLKDGWSASISQRHPRRASRPTVGVRRAEA